MKRYETVISLNTAVVAASGNPYWKLQAPKLGLNEKDRELLIFLNPKWKQAEETAQKEQTRNKTPMWTVLVADYDRPENSFNGSGALWKRNGKVSGSFEFNDQVFDVTLEKSETTVTSVDEETGEETETVQVTNTMVFQQIEVTSLADALESGLV